MGDQTVREATSGDVSAIVRVAERGWNAAYGDLLDRGTIDAAVREWYDPSVVRDRVEREDGAYLVAERDGRVVGYAAGGPSDRDGVATLGAIYVEPDAWGAGVGTDLLDRFEAWCRRREFGVVQFRVLDGNDRAAAFYRARGYEAVDEVEAELFGEDITEHVFRRTLD